MDPILGAALIGGGASLLGSLFGSAGQSSANRTNLQIARETNQMQKQLQDEQNAWNLEQWNRNNQYNTPSAQMDRYRSAGLNPYLMMSGGAAGSGNSQSPAQGVNPSQLSTPTMQSYDPSASFGQISSIIGDYGRMLHEQKMSEADTRLKNAEAGNMEIRNAYEQARQRFELDRMFNDVQEGKLRRKHGQLDYDFKKATFSYDVAQHRLAMDQAKTNIDLTKVQIDSVALANEMQRLHIKNFPAQAAAEIQLMKAQTYQAYQNGVLAGESSKLAKAQAEHEVWKQTETILRSYGIVLDNKQKDELRPYIVDRYGLENDRLIKQNNRDFWDKDLEPVPTYSRFILRNFNPFIGLFGKR